jgi:hypothetical protein
MEAIAIPTIIKALVSTLLFYALVLCVIAFLLRLTMRPVAAGSRDVSQIAPFRTREGKARIEEALVDFFARSNVSASILDVLAAQRKPIRFKALIEEVRGDNARGRVDADMPVSAFRGVLFILLATQLARMSSAGLSITPLGREVHRRMPAKAMPYSPVSMHHANASHRQQTASPRASAVLPLWWSKAQGLTILFYETQRSRT